MSNARPLPMHAPTGQVPWPLILLEGPEKVGKTYGALEFSGDDRIGATFALDLGEDSLEEYGQIPGARYGVVEHDGTWGQIIDRVEGMVEHGHLERAAGRVPLAIIDSATAEWDMLKDWVGTRARRQPSNKAKLARDPDAEIKASRNLWNDAASRHNRFMNTLRRFPGPVIFTARGKWVSATGKDGQPVQGQQEYSVESQKGLGYAVNAWVRLSRDQGPQIIGLRHPRWGIRPGIDAPKELDNFSLGWLIFDVLGCSLGTARDRSTVELNADEVMPDEVVEAPDGEQQTDRPARRSGADSDAPRGQDRGGAPVRPGRDPYGSTGPAPAPDPEPPAEPAPATDPGPTAEEEGRRYARPSERDASAQQQPSLERIREMAQRAVLYLVQAPDATTAATREQWAHGLPIAGRDVADLLTDADRAALGVPPGVEVTLRGLASAVTAHVTEHGRAVRSPLDAERIPA